MWKFLANNYVYDGVAGRLFKLDANMFAEVYKSIETHKEQYQTIEFPGLGRYSNARHENATPSLSRGRSHFRHIVVVLTEKCNLACSYCPYPADETRSHHMGGKFHSASELNNIIKFLAQNIESDTTLSFYGGEPLLRFKDMERVVESLAALRTDWQGRFSLTSNFTFYSDNIGAYLANSKAVMLLSIDGPKHTHDSKRIMFSGQSSFDKATNNIQRLKASHPEFYRTRVGINSVISTTNFNEIDEFFKEHFSEVSLIRFSVVQNFDTNNIGFDEIGGIKLALEVWATERLLSLSSVEALAYSPLALDFARKTLQPIMSRANVSFEQKRFTSCQPGDKLVINSDLSFGVCEKTERISQGSIQAGFTGSDAVALEFSTMLENRCKYCFASPMCSVCYATIWDGTKLSRERLDRYCNDFRSRTRRILEVYVKLRDKFENFDQRISAIMAEGTVQFNDLEDM